MLIPIRLRGHTSPSSWIIDLIPMGGESWRVIDQKAAGRLRSSSCWW